MNRIIKKAEMNYWRNQFAESNNSKDFWKVVRKVQGKSNKKPIAPIDNGRGSILTEAADKANCLNEYFSNIGLELAENFDNTETPLINFHRVTPTCSTINISEQQVYNSLKNIPKKAGGTDDIDSKELSVAGEKLMEGIFGIFKKKHRNKHFPPVMEARKSSTSVQKGCKIIKRKS